MAEILRMVEVSGPIEEHIAEMLRQRSGDQMLYLFDGIIGDSICYTAIVNPKVVEGKVVSVKDAEEPALALVLPLRVKEAE